MRLFTLFILVLVTACSQAPEIPKSIASVSAVTDQERIVRAFMKGFNAHDPAAMTALCAENVRWAYYTDGSFATAGEGKNALVAQMTDYFTATPKVRSELEKLIVNGDSVAVTERVFWTPIGQEAEQSQAALSVYQLEDGLISSVWYYPAVR